MRVGRPFEYPAKPIKHLRHRSLHVRTLLKRTIVTMSRYPDDVHFQTT